MFGSGLDELSMSGPRSRANDIDDAVDDDTESGAVTAGMDISVGGAQLTHIVFFDGKAEMFGHLMSGTASERLSAVSAHALFLNHRWSFHLTVS